MGIFKRNKADAKDKDLDKLPMPAVAATSLIILGLILFVISFTVGKGNGQIGMYIAAGLLIVLGIVGMILFLKFGAKEFKESIRAESNYRNLLMQQAYEETLRRQNEIAEYEYEKRKAAAEAQGANDNEVKQFVHGEPQKIKVTKTTKKGKK
ncbi:MAG: hypothetical protein LBM76_00635 [Mycoplasmataceae bacterium]|jgi:uncharacterized membrane protein|nr:hypothetical protein [Mycoplasmataceae bacterium]